MENTATAGSSQSNISRIIFEKKKVKQSKTKLLKQKTDDEMLISSQSVNKKLYWKRQITLFTLFKAKNLK